MEITFRYHLDSNTVIATKFCTWHDSCAVAACANIVAIWWPVTDNSKAKFPSNLKCGQKFVSEKGPRSVNTNPIYMKTVHALVDISNSLHWFAYADYFHIQTRSTPIETNRQRWRHNLRHSAEVTNHMIIIVFRYARLDCDGNRSIHSVVSNMVIP